MDRGKLAILLMVLLACGLGLVSVAYHRWASHGVLAWWGGDSARLIADAPHAEALRLEPLDQSATAGDDRITIDGRQYRIVARKDVTTALGLDHVRRGLLDDGNFVWPAAPAERPPRWDDALVFSDGARRITVLFDFADRRLGRTDAQSTLSIDENAKGWQDFFADLFAGKGGAAAKTQRPLP